VFDSHVNLRRTSAFRTNYCSLLSLEMLREVHTFCFGDFFETRLDSNKKITCATHPLILMTYFPKERRLGYNIAECVLE